MVEPTAPITQPHTNGFKSKIINGFRSAGEFIGLKFIYILPALFILALIVIIVEAVKNPKNKGLKWAAYSLGVIIPLVLLSLYIAYKFKDSLGQAAGAVGLKNAMLILMILLLIITLTLDILAFLNPKNKSLQVSAVTFTILFFTAFIGYIGKEFFERIYNQITTPWKIFTIAIGLGVFSTLLYFIFLYVFPPSGTPPELITGRILEWILLGIIAWKSDLAFASKIQNFFPLKSMYNLIEQPFQRIAMTKFPNKEDLSYDFVLHWYELLIVIIWTILFIIFSYRLLKRRDL